MASGRHRTRGRAGPGRRPGSPPDRARARPPSRARWPSRSGGTRPRSPGARRSRTRRRWPVGPAAPRGRSPPSPSGTSRPAPRPCPWPGPAQEERRRRRRSPRQPVTARPPVQHDRRRLGRPECRDDERGRHVQRMEPRHGGAGRGRGAGRHRVRELERRHGVTDDRRFVDDPRGHDLGAGQEDRAGSRARGCRCLSNLHGRHGEWDERLQHLQRSVQGGRRQADHRPQPRQHADGVRPGRDGGGEGVPGAPAQGGVVQHLRLDPHAGRLRRPGAPRVRRLRRRRGHRRQLERPQLLHRDRHLLGGRPARP